MGYQSRGWCAPGDFVNPVSTSPPNDLLTSLTDVSLQIVGCYREAVAKLVPLDFEIGFAFA